MEEEYGFRMRIDIMNESFTDYMMDGKCSHLAKDILMRIAKMKEGYIMRRLRYPFNRMPFAKLAMLFVILCEERPIIEHDTVKFRAELRGNPRYPEWVSRIFIRGN